MDDEIGYIVVEYNQVGSGPEIADGTLWHLKKHANEMAQALRDANRASGRRDRFVVAVLTEAEEDDT